MLQVVKRRGGENMNSKENIYKSIITVLSYIELIVTDKKQFSIVRKQLLDIANNVMRLGDDNARE